MPPIPPSVVWTVGAAIGVAVAGLAFKEWRRINEALHARRTVPVPERAVREALPKLRRDPRTGVYRPD